MKKRYGDQSYQILRWENGQWMPCGYGGTRDEGRVTLPEEVRKRLAEGRDGEFGAEGYRYWIRPTRKEPEST